MEKANTLPLEVGYQLVSEKGTERKTYRIEKMLGRGGFGITYLATAEELVGNIPQITHYTIKEFCTANVCLRQEDGSITVPDHEREDFENDKADFLREAKRLYEMHQEGIVPVNEVFEANGTAYYVMQYLGEMSLVKYVKENGGSLDEEEAKRIAIAVSNALDYIHKQKVTHLDVKPENIMMLKRRNGSITPVLIDFGLACHYKKNGSSTSKHSATGITEGYSPLEQYAGIEKFSPEADIYALGATLYFMLTGKAPLKAADMSAQYLFKTLPDGLADGTVEVLRKSMEKMAERRIKSIAEFQKIITQGEDVIEGGQVTVKRRPQKQKAVNGSTNLMKYGIIGLGAVVALLLILLLMQTCDGKEPSVKEPPVTPDTTATVATNGELNQVNSNLSNTPEQQSVQQQPASSQQADSPQQAAQSQINTTTSHSSSTSQGADQPSTSPAQKNHLDLGYAVWRGPVKNGKPHGDGVMTFKSSHRIDSRDPAGNIAESGDYVDGTYVNGHLDQGTWHKVSGGSEYLLIGQ